MSTVSFNNSQTFKPCDFSECDEEGSCCSDGGDFAGHENLKRTCSRGSIDFDSESEAAMCENDDCVDENNSPFFRFMAGTSDRQAQQRIHDQHQQYAKMVWADPTTSESSWTDEKHSLYLNSIEEAFVKSLHERGHYTYACKKWEAEGITPCMSDKGLYEDVESRISYDYQPFILPGKNGAEAQRHCSHEDIQNRTKRSRLEESCIKQLRLQIEDMNAMSRKANNFQSEREPFGEGTTGRRDVSNKSSPKIQIQSFQDTSNHDHGGRDTETLEHYMQEDQVVPSMENTSKSSS